MLQSRIWGLQLNQAESIRGQILYRFIRSYAHVESLCILMDLTRDARVLKQHILHSVKCMMGYLCV